jgi:hypothetical protein
MIYNYNFVSRSKAVKNYVLNFKVMFFLLFNFIISFSLTILLLSYSKKRSSEVVVVVVHVLKLSNLAAVKYGSGKKTKWRMKRENKPKIHAFSVN